MDFKQLAKAGFQLLRSQAPEIMLGGGIVLYTLAIVESVRTTPRYLTERDQIVTEKGGPLNAKEEVVTVIRVYRIPIIFYTLATINIVGAYNIQNHTIMTLTTGINTLALAYNKNLKELETYKDEVINNLGETKAARIESAINQDIVDNSDFSLIYDTGTGNVIFKDKWTGHVLKGSQNQIDRGFLVLEEDMKTDDWVDIGRLYEIWFEHNRSGMPKDIDSFDVMGWSLDDVTKNRRYGNVLIDHRIGSTYSQKLQQAVTTIEYRPTSVKDWRGYL